MERKAETLQNVFSGVLAACAVIAVAVLVRREGNAGAPPTQQTVSLSSEQWDEAKAAGHRLGPADAALTIVEFSDFECPVCASFERQVLRPLREEQPGRVAIVFRHWPLDYHRHARSAAIAGECAAQVGQFEAMYEAIFDRQDSLGILTYEQFAERAGISGESGIQDCLRNPPEFPAIERDLALALRIGGTGTPTVIVNGVRFVSRPPTRAELDSVLSSLQVPGD